MTTIEYRLPPDYRAASLRADALAGLTATPKSLPPKWFYDAQGSALFEKITELPEYYPTRAERSILQRGGGEIARLSQARVLVELGSGSSEKTRLLLSALRAAGTLRGLRAGRRQRVGAGRRGGGAGGRVPGAGGARGRLGFRAVPRARAARRAATRRERRGRGWWRSSARRSATWCPPSARSSCGGSARSLRPGDSFLLGTDLVKDVGVLVAAYDDSAGVTAAFNKNVLAVLNAELGADFDLDAFEHVAVWDPANEWIEMRLRSTARQRARVRDLDLDVDFAAGEEMRTEVSAKFRRAGVEAELAAAGLALRAWWTDPAERFGLSLSVPV